MDACRVSPRVWKIDGRWELSAMAVDSNKLVTYNQIKFQREIAFGAWPRRWAMLRKWGRCILNVAHFAIMTRIHCEHEV